MNPPFQSDDHAATHPPREGTRPTDPLVGVYRVMLLSRSVMTRSRFRALQLRGEIQQYSSACTRLPGPDLLPDRRSWFVSSSRRELSPSASFLISALRKAVKELAGHQVRWTASEYPVRPHPDAFLDLINEPQLKCTDIAKERLFGSSNQIKEIVERGDTEAARLRPFAHPRLCQSTHAGSAAWTH